MSENFPPRLPARSATVQAAIDEYLGTVSTGRSPRTYRAYQNTLKLFVRMLAGLGIDPAAPVTLLAAGHLAAFARYLQETPYRLGRKPAIPRQTRIDTPGKKRAPSSVRAGMIAARQFLAYVHAAGLHPELSPTALTVTARSSTPGVGKRIVNFPIEEIRELILYVEGEAFTAPPQRAQRSKAESRQRRLIRLRDRAVVLTLADTGLRVSELCNLKRKDIDRKKFKATIIGKGDKQAQIRFSPRSMQAISAYLYERRHLDGLAGNLGNNPVFCRHDRGAGRKVKRLGDNGVRQVIDGLVAAVFPNESDLQITPHTFRHLFVTEVVLATKDIGQAQKLARHESIGTTERYSHFADTELDTTYADVFGGPPKG
jgi:site-specific recombinase XerD